MHFHAFSHRWLARLLTFALWALVAGSAMFWALQRSPRVAAASSADDGAIVTAVLDPQWVARALGADATEAAPASKGALDGRLHLHGVITHGVDGAALVSVDDGPPRPVRVGQTPTGLDGHWILRQVAPHSVVFAAGASQIELQMPAMQERSRAGDAVAPERSESTQAVSASNAPRNINARPSRLSQRRVQARNGE